MKYIKLLAVIALLGVFASCEKTFEPETGNTAVEFVNTEETVDLLGAYHYIPVQMVEQSTTAAKAIVRFTGGMVEFKDGTKRDVVEFTNDAEGYANGGDILVTSYEIYVGAYDTEVDGEGLPTNRIEVLIPNYKNIKRIELNFELTGQNVGGNSTTKYIAKLSEDIMLGDWKVGTDMAFNIAKKTGSSYVLTIPTNYGDVTVNATRSGLVLTTEPMGSQVDAGVGELLDSHFCAYDAESGGFDPETGVIMTFNEADGTFVATNGMVLVMPYGGSWYLMGPSPVAAGSVGTK